MAENNIEDVDTTAEDHCFDEAALIAMARPISMEKPKSRPSMYDQRIDDLMKQPHDDFEDFAIQSQHEVMKEMGLDMFPSEMPVEDRGGYMQTKSTRR
jgi:hypothetical protein